MNINQGNTRSATVNPFKKRNVVKPTRSDEGIESNDFSQFNQAVKWTTGNQEN